MAQEYVVFAGPDVAPFRFKFGQVKAEVDGDGELYLKERHGARELIAVFARQQWVCLVTRDEDEPPHLGPDLTAVQDES